MDAQENGTASLEDLARRLGALERENATLRHEVALLKGSEGGGGEVLAARGPESSEELEEGRISRRRLLSRVGAAAAGLVVAGSLTQRDIREAKAAIAETSSAIGTPALKGTHTAGGWGVCGISEGDSEGQVGVVGEVFGSGEGVRGNTTGGGRGVTGSSGSGYGGLFTGGKAQLRLLPSDRTGRPGGAHSKGEIYMDINAALFVCVRGGTPGRWRKVSTTAV